MRPVRGTTLASGYAPDANSAMAASEMERTGPRWAGPIEFAQPNDYGLTLPPPLPKLHMFFSFAKRVFPETFTPPAW